MTKTFLCLDYGTKRIGLAIAKSPLAEPLQIISNNQNTLEKLVDICQRHQVTNLVVGVSEGSMADQSRFFGHKIAGATNLPVVFHDETLSSIETQQKLLRSGAKKSKKRSPIDHLAAAAILQDFLDETKPFQKS